MLSLHRSAPLARLRRWGAQHELHSCQLRLMGLELFWNHLLPASGGLIMTATEQTLPFPLYRCINPATTCESPFIAVAGDGSAFLELGNNSLCIDWLVSDEKTTWLAEDFVPMGQVIHFDLALLHNVVSAAFGDRADFLAMRFGPKLRPRSIELSLVAQKAAEDGPEYRIDAAGRYQRVYRIPRRKNEVTLPERAVLEVCVEFANDIASRYSAELREPPPLRWRSASVA